jgi:hypothetical protein
MDGTELQNLEPREFRLVIESPHTTSGLLVYDEDSQRLAAAGSFWVLSAELRETEQDLQSRGALLEQRT